ncbi:MAG: tetratricopeptide repeat protein [Polyangiaceae bacterium]|nr:tetratricopeptide repeat protein [Polyangiaceae bacterium]
MTVHTALRDPILFYHRVLAAFLALALCRCASSPPAQPARDPTSSQPLASMIQDCKRGDGEQCYLIGRLREEKMVVTRGDGEGVSYMQRACDLGFTLGCVSEAMNAFRVATSATERSRVICSLARFCKQGFGKACFALGVIEADKDLSAAMTNWEAACNLGVLPGCISYAGAALSGAAPQSEAIAKGRVFLTKACSAGEPMGCWVLGAADLKGAGLPARDPVAAARLFARGCELGASVSCFYLGLRYAKGDGVHKDGPRAARSFEKACNQAPPDVDACEIIAMIYEAGHAGLGIRKDLAEKYRRRAREAKAEEKSEPKPILSYKFDLKVPKADQ